MKILKTVTGYLDENCYLLFNEDTKKALVVDPGSGEEKLDMLIEKYELKLVGILVTHYHFDHVGALDHFIEKYKAKVYDYQYKDECIKCGGYTIEVVSTCGHTDQDVSFYFRDENKLFTGDFLFKNSIGRYDFENSDLMEMQKSLQLIKTFDPVTKVYPGHGDVTTLEDEFKNNEYLK